MRARTRALQNLVAASCPENVPTGARHGTLGIDERGDGFMGIDDGEANFPIPSHQIPQRVVLLWPGPGAMRVLQGAFACVHGP